MAEKKELDALKKKHLELCNEFGAKILTVSKIKEYFKEMGHRSDAELPEALAAEVYRIMWRALMRCDGNNRVTVTPNDL